MTDFSNKNKRNKKTNPHFDRLSVNKQQKTNNKKQEKRKTVSLKTHNQPT